ncbi:AAA family ATPase [Clostridium butyricum]|uniref:AAA family ATPase n=2 Tax=Clostridium butyricum TaxID=1492 RepID=UPI0005C21173|nr:AAA family ATPase [Clostridium butyricum]KIU07786.1 Helicase RecD/TraA [Clostridium butyricum]MBA8967617.1 exodeoxyribonuclease V alpha subunit [Clostridium butyricum]MBA8971316.1 exodeoxyribonuclease V alpha subunit [Clostridium butyricum]MBC2429378.1 AAA family ATPase [Clostridium butyricum]NOW36818.1 exodeoxyribonuclease V alpha subunit [Clostridium butyricum]
MKVYEYLRNNRKELEYFLENIFLNKSKESICRLIEELDNSYINESINNSEVDQIHNIINLYINLKELLDNVCEFNISLEKIIIDIYRIFKEDSYNQLLKNPYILCEFLEEDFKVADKLAYYLEFEEVSELRIKSGILCFFKRDIVSKKGHMYIKRDYMILGSCCYINKNNGFTNYNLISEEDIEEYLDMLIDEEVFISNINENKEDIIYLKKYYDIENYIATNIKERLNFSYTNNSMNMLESKQLKKYNLTEHQEGAVLLALNNSISIITGGAGVGKTQVISVLYSIIKEINENLVVEICAPTGKAVSRLNEVNNMNAKTIHKLFKIGSINEGKNKVSADYLIIDEASMLDAEIFYKILRNTEICTQIVLVGDVNQLPSIDSGQVLKDLVKTNVIPKFNLSEVHRQAIDSLILRNAQTILNNRDIIFDSEECVFIQSDIKNVISDIMRIYEDIMSDCKYYIEDIMLLTTTNDNILGCNNLNEAIQKWYQEDFNDNIEYINKGDRVIQCINDYEKNVMNGETAFVKSIIKNDEGTIYNLDFGYKQIQYDQFMINQLKIAYSLTIHKCQGSEYNIVIIPVFKENMINATKNYMYTAITRAKKKVIFVGDMEVLIKVVSTNDKIRNSMLSSKLENEQIT